MTAHSLQAGGPEPDAGQQRIASAPQWLAIGGAWALYWLIYTLLPFAPSPYHASDADWGRASANVLAMALFWTLATPLVFALARRLRPDHVGWPRALSVHALSALV